jgi:hypothetical protein
MILFIKCDVDRAGEVVLEYLLILLEQDLCITGNQNVRKMIAISAWYLWYERRKLVHKETTQNAHQISMGIHSLMANFLLLPLQRFQ